MRFCLTFLYLFRREKKNKNPLNEDSLYNGILIIIKYGKNYFFSKKLHKNY